MKRARSNPEPVVASLGCKVNQAEAAWLRAELARQGVDPRELVVLLTCTVTATAARQSRQMARRLARAHPGARVVVSGCDVQLDPERYRGMGLTVLGRAELARLPELAAAGGPWPASEPAPPQAGPLCPGLEPPGPRRTRGLLKVQDGCDASCAYCIVPRVRGAPRSLPPDQAAAAFAHLGQQGAAEVVLTGVHLGRYGQDLERPLGLAGLVRRLLAAHPLPRLRLSSLEVSEVDPELAALLAAEPRLCPHLHLPLQSGSDRLLAAMGRPYRAADYAVVVHTLAQSLPDLCLGADVMVGLPGEGEADFARTLELIRSLPVAYLHVFPYSPRPGTPAAEMDRRPPGPEVRRRAAVLRELGEAKRLAFLRKQVGRRLVAVVEAGGLARSGNYCLVRLEQQLPPGTLVEVEVTGLEEQASPPRLRGRVREL